MSVKFLAQANNGLPLTESELMWLAILRLLVRRVNHLATRPHYFTISFIKYLIPVGVFQNDICGAVGCCLQENKQIE